MGRLVCGSSWGWWGCGVLGWVTNEESILFFLHPAQEFGHYQDGTCLCHQGAEAGIEFKFGSHPGQQCLPLGHMVNEAQGSGGTVEACVQTVVQVRQALPLLLPAVWGLQLGAA